MRLHWRNIFPGLQRSKRNVNEKSHRIWIVSHTRWDFNIHRLFTSYSTSISVSENFEEKLFVQFLVLIYRSYIKKQMDEKGLYKKYTMQTLLDDLDIIELYQQPGRAHHLSEITKKQMALYNAMGVPFPK